MARMRVIHPGFFTNADLGACAMAARLLFAGLWCIADKCGRCEDRPAFIRSRLFPFDDDVRVDPLLAELASRGFVKRYVVEGRRLIQVTHWTDYQRPHHREAPSHLPPPLGHVDIPEHYAPRDEHEAEPEVAPRVSETMPGVSETMPGAEPVVSDHIGSDRIGSYSHAPHVVPSTVVEDPSRDLVGDPIRANGTRYAIPPCPHEKILALWAEVLPELPQHRPAMWRGTRAVHLRARWRETADAQRWATANDGLVYFRRLFGFIGRSPFLTGHTKSRDARGPFFAELAWCVEAEHWAAIIEGKYHPTETSS